MSRDFHSSAAFPGSVRRGGREKELAEIDLRPRSRARGGRRSGVWKMELKAPGSVRGGGKGRFTADGVIRAIARRVGRGCEPANRPERDPRDHAGG